jgi:hypothetical protein
MLRALFTLFLVISLSASVPVTAVFGQQATNTTASTETPTGDKVIAPSTTVTKFIDDTGLTINHVPPGWSVIDHDNTSPEEVSRQQELGGFWAVTLCPPYSKVNTSSQFSYGCEPIHGQVLIWHYPTMDKNEYIVPEATVVNPDTGLLELNLTAQNILDYTTSPVYDMVVQQKTVPISVTAPENGTSLQLSGLLVLLTDPTELKLSEVGLYFVDNTTGYSITVSGPVGTPDPDEALPLFIPRTPDPRGDPIPIHGIGLDNLPPVMAEPMKIINSISITRR